MVSSGIERHPLARSIEDQLWAKSESELIGVLRGTRLVLEELGVSLSPAFIIEFSEQQHRGHFEDKRDKKTNRKLPTAMNAFMNLLVNYPSLKQLEKDQFVRLADVVSTITMVNEILLERSAGEYIWTKWPLDLQKEPRGARTEYEGQGV